MFERHFFLQILKKIGLMTIIHSIVKRSPFKGPSPLDLFTIGMEAREYDIDQFLKMSENHIKITRITFTKW